MLRPQHGEWVWIEGDSDHEQVVGVGELARTAYDVPVPKVDTVKVADDDDRTTQIGRHIGEGTPDSHDVNLLACEWGTP